MFALKFTYLLCLGIWLGSLISMRYVVPAALSGQLINREIAAATALETVGKFNKLGIACAIAMAGALFLQALLAGELLIEQGFIFLLVLIFILLGITEILYRNRLNSLKTGEPGQSGKIQNFPLHARNLLPAAYVSRCLRKSLSQ